MAIVSTFPTVDNTVVVTATREALEALRDERTPARVAEYYDPTTDYAGATFAQLEPNDPDAITATDLLAVTTLAIDIRTSALRKFLQTEDNARNLKDKLRALPNKRLEETDEADFAAMGEFYDTVKALLSRSDANFSNPWVTTSKLVARKRPGLFPVRDSVVCAYLGIDRLRDYAKDWYVFRELMRNGDIVDELGRLPDRVREAAAKQIPSRDEATPSRDEEEPSLILDTEPLRLLDAVLWRQGSLQSSLKS